MKAYFYDLHCHTSASRDSDTSLEELVRIAKQRGLHGIAITDHDIVYTGEEVIDGLELIPGDEITLADGTHLLAFFITSASLGRSLAEAVNDVHAQGGHAFLAHPTRRGQGWLDVEARDQLDIKAVLGTVDGVEAANAKDNHSQCEANASFIQAYNGLIRGKVAGSDAHRADEVGYIVIQTSEPISRRNMLNVLSSAKIVIRPEYEKARQAAEQWRQIGVRIAKITGLYYHTGARNVLYHWFQRLTKRKMANVHFRHRGERV